MIDSGQIIQRLRYFIKHKQTSLMWLSIIRQVLHTWNELAMNSLIFLKVLKETYDGVVMNNSRKYV